MTWFVHRSNLLDKARPPIYVSTGCSVRSTLSAVFPGFVEFGAPTLILVDRVPVLRRDWDKPVASSSCIEAIAVQNGVETLAIISLVVTAASLITTAFLIAMMPSATAVLNGELPAAAPVFTFEGQENQKRLNQIIEKAYGRNRWWPAYLSAPYIVYVENRPTIRLLLSLGFGDYDVEQVNINDSSFDTIAAASYQYLPTGFSVDDSLPFDIVCYAKDFANTELRGPNEDDYAVVGPYAISSAGTSVNQVYVNVAFPAGLYDLSGADLAARTVTYLVAVTPIDSNGRAIGATTTTSFSHTAGSTTPQRFTDAVTLPSTGRYSISVARTSDKNTSTSGQDRMQVESVCGLARSYKTYAVSALAIQLLGSDVITADSAQKINLVATAKIPVYTGYAWQVQATRNPVWAFLDVFRAVYGAGLSDDNFDLGYYAQLAKEASIYTYDQYINNKSTVWETAKAIARVMRGEPYIAGSDIRIAFDSPTQVPVAMFNQDNAVGLKWKINFKQPLECDCVEVAFVDPVTGLQDTVMFTPPGSTGVNPKKITLDGAQNRDLAWQYGAYYYFSLVLQREAVTFTTGLEGFVPLFGDLIAVSWSFPAWGKAGAVISYNSATLTVEVSEPCQVSTTAKWLALRTERGEVYGPVQVTQGDDLYHLVLGSALTRYFDFSAEAGMPVLFTFGDSSVITRTFKVTKTTSSNGQFKIEAIKRDPAIFSYDGIAAPDRGQDLLPYPATSGSIPWVKLFDENAQFVRVQWGVPVNGATVEVAYYTSPTATTEQLASPWTAGFTMTSVTDIFGTTAYLPRTKGYLYIRVRTSSALADTYWWRAYIGDFEAIPPTSYPAALMLVNNCDANYVAPLDPANASSLYPQATVLFDGATSWDVGLKALTFVCDTPDMPLTLTLTAFYGSRLAAATAYLTQGGKYTFTREQLLANGFDRVGDLTHSPTITCAATTQNMNKLVELGITPLPLTNGPAGSVSQTYLGASNPDCLNVHNYSQWDGQYDKPAQLKGAIRNYLLSFDGTAGFESVFWDVYPLKTTTKSATFSARVIGSPYIGAPDIKKVDAVLTLKGWLTCRGGYVTSYNHSGHALAVAYYADSLTEVFPGTVFRLTTPRGFPETVLLKVLCSLEANTPDAPNTFTTANAYLLKDRLMELADTFKLRFLLVEYAFLSGDTLTQAYAYPIDLFGRKGNDTPIVNILQR